MLSSLNTLEFWGLYHLRNKFVVGEKDKILFPLRLRGASTYMLLAFLDTFVFVRAKHRELNRASQILMARPLR